MNASPVYSIPARYRRMENMHILFWLLKDISWCMIWKPLGLAMIFPTLIIAIVISWRTREVPSELAHNLAVTFWIAANSYWMISEFFGFDEVHIWRSFEGKHLALIPFFIGLSFLVHFYLFAKKRNNEYEPLTHED
jgi:prepilin signal peptidase PulO-like enzyme (type II secretory pathway)